jgi:hypothetical protein
MATTTINVTNQLQDLQSVTDQGNITTNDITVDSNNAYSLIQPSDIGTENKNTGSYAYLGADGTLGLHNGDVESELKNTMVSSGNSVILEFPNKPTGTYIIATNADIPAEQIQSDWNQTDNTEVDYIKNKPTIPVLYSGTFFDITTQNNGGATTANQVKISTTQQSTGFTLSNNSIQVLNNGIYFINLLMQLSFTGGASNYNVTVWFTVDDVIVPNSAFTFTTTGAQNDQTLANITDTITLTSGQVLKFYWWSQATGMKLLTTAAGSNPTRPASPSVNFTIFNVG